MTKIGPAQRRAEQPFARPDTAGVRAFGVDFAAGMPLMLATLIGRFCYFGLR
jgi:hypothetical protein